MSEKTVNPGVNPENEVTPLLDGEDFKGFKIREWTLKQLVQISPVLEQMVTELESRGVTWEQFAALFDDAKTAKKTGQVKTTFSGAFRMLNGILPVLPSFLAVSLDRDVKEVEALKGPFALTLAVKVISVNLIHVASFFEELTREIAGIQGRTLTMAASRSQDSSTS